MLKMVEVAENTALLCDHCGEICETDYAHGEQHFCCMGCQAAYRSIKDNGLDYFYQLRDELLDQKKSEIQSHNQLEYLDDPMTAEHFMNEQGYYRFYVEGVQCAACIWLLESLAKVNNFILDMRIHYLDNTLEVLLSASAKPSEAFEFIQSFGYQLNPIKKNQSLSHFQNLEAKKRLNHIAVAAVCAGNIMLLSFADYFGADFGFATAFRWISFALFIPILTYSAKDILLNSFYSLTRFRPSLDLPVSIAIVAGFILSTISLILKTPYVYFDSLSVTVFLILASRYLIRNYKESVLKDFHGTKALIPDIAKKDDGSYVLTEAIQVGDLIVLKQGEVIPCDAIVESGRAWLNEAILSGEANLKAVHKGALVYAGTHIEKGELTIRALKERDESRFSILISESQHQAMFKLNASRFEEKFAYYFTLVCLAMSGLSLIYFYNDLGEGMKRALALLIVACPCAIAFGSPLIYTRSLRFLAKYKLFLKNINTLNKIVDIKNIVFDKTGTLTSSTFGVKEIEFSSLQHRSAILAIESKSDHPIAKAICNHFPFFDTSEEVKDFKVIPGQGVSAKIGKTIYSIQHIENKENFVLLHFFADNKKVGSALLGENIKPNLNNLKSKLFNKDLHIISGDKPYLVKRVAEHSGITQTRSEMSPEEKAKYIEALDSTMMVGDGINDSAAIAKADIGLSVTGSITKAFQHADVLLLSDNILDIKKLWSAAKTNKKAHRNLFIFSVVYNLITASLAFAGFILPVVAAILMPLSSILVALLVHFSTKETIWE